MAEVSISGPVVDQDYDSDTWQAASADESGIVNDWDGSAFRLTRPGSGTIAEIGSTTLHSVAHVGGYGIRIPEGQTQSVDIPVSTNAVVGRWDLIVARYNSAWLASMPRGPVRIHRIAGVEGSDELPSWDNRPYDATEDVPLWAIRRVQGTSLAASEVRDMRVWTGKTIYVKPEGLLPSASLGSQATRNGITYLREMVGTSPDWVRKNWPLQRLTGTDATAATVPGWGRNDECSMVRDGEGLGHRTLVYVVTRGNVAPITSDARGSFGSSPVGVGTLIGVDRPPAGSLIPMTGRVKSAAGNLFGASGVLGSTGAIALDATAPNLSLAEGAEVILTASWWV